MHNNKRLSYCGGTAQCTMLVEILSAAPQLYKKSHFKRPALGAWPWRICHYLTLTTSHRSLPISDNSVSVLHRLRDDTTFTVYVTACDFEKSFSFNKTVEITGHITLRFTCKHSIVYTYYISRGMGVKMVSDSKSDLQSHWWWSSRSLVLVSFDRPFTVFYYLVFCCNYVCVL